MIAMHAGFAKAYWTTLRPYLFLVSGSSGLVGLATTKELSPIRLIAALLVFCIVYGLGQAITDVTQIDTDSLSAPYRPLVRGELSRGWVVAVSGVGLGLCSLTLFALNASTLALAASSVIGVVTYTSMKRLFWAGPAHNSWIVALLVGMGALADGRSLTQCVLDPNVVAATIAVFASYATFVLLGYLKDVEADRATNYNTLPVRFGRRATIWVSAACVPFALLASLFIIANSAAASLGWALGAAACGTGAVSLVRAHVLAFAATRDELAHPAISTCVRGFVALHLGEATALHPTWWPLALVLYAGFELAMATRPCMEQV